MLLPFIIIINDKFPNSISIFVFWFFCKSLECIKIFYHGIFGCRIIITDQLSNACISCLSDKFIHHCEFHITLQHAATHKPQFHMKFIMIFSIYSSNNNTYNSIITKFVQKPAIQGNVIRILCHFFYIILTITLCCQVKLITLVGQLCNSRHIHWNKALNLSLHSKRFEIILIICKGCLKVATLRILLIHLISFQIICGKHCNFKKTWLIYSLNVVLYLSNLRNRNTFDLFLNNRSFCRIIIYKYKALRKKRKFLSCFHYIYTLWVPVCLKANKIIHFKYGIRSFETTNSIRLLIFWIYS